MLVIPELGKSKQEDCDFQANLVYTARLPPSFLASTSVGHRSLRVARGTGLFWLPRYIFLMTMKPKRTRQKRVLPVKLARY